MKKSKTTPAIFASFLVTAVLGTSMVMVGLDATKTASTTTTAANTSTSSQTTTQSTTSSYQAPTTRQSSAFTPVLRTGGS